MSTICLAIFTDGFLYAVVVPVFPYFLSDSGVPKDEVQMWSSLLLTCFGGATLLLSPICGWLADNASSRRLPLLIGLVLQAGSTALFSGSPSVHLLLVARALQGFSAAVVYSVGLALLVDTVGSKDVGQQAGYVLSSANLGVLTGPLLGGFVYEQAGYHAVVAMMIGLVSVDILLRLVVIEKKTAAKWRPIKTFNTYGTIADPVESPHDYSNSDPNDDQPSCAGDLSSPTGEDSAHREPSEDVDRPLLSKSRSPSTYSKIPPIFRLVKSPRILADIYAVFVTYALLTCFDSDLSLFVKKIFGWGSTGGGLIFLTIALPSLLGPLAGYCSDRFGARWIVSGGFVVNFVCLLALQFVEYNTKSSRIGLCALMSLIGTALTFVLSPVAGDLTTTVEELGRAQPNLYGKSGAYAQAFSLFNCAIAAGTTAGPLWTSFAIAKLGWGWTNVILAIFALTGAVVAVLSLTISSPRPDEGTPDAV
ncbi:MAG: hypothetical protein M1825_005783 [Sarcosagium campestre]|nr:MAG: hypothetical protein M1825_005783 [Sarcosagium campestre]